MGNITVDRYFDKIVLSNPGTMLVSKEEFEEGNHSVCRNPLLQKMFVFIGVGEKSGSGADVIAKGWLDNGWKLLPTIREVNRPDRVEMTLYLPITDDNVTDKLPITGDKPTINPSSGDKTDEKVAINDDNPTINPSSGDKTDDKISDRTLKLVLKFITEHPNCKTTEISAAINLQVTQTKWYIYRLLDEGKIMAHGANRNRTYSVK